MIFWEILVKYKVINESNFKLNYLLYFTARRGADYLHHEDDVSQCKIKRRRMI